MKRNGLLFLKRVLIQRIFIVPAILMIPTAMMQAAIITTAGNGNWNSTTVNAPWPGGTVPLSTDEVIIATGHTIDLTAIATIRNLTIQTGAFLNVGGFNFTVTGTTSLTGTINHTSTAGTKVFTGLVTINAGGVWNNSANEDINFRGGLTYNGATFAAGTGIHTFTTNSQAISGTLTIPRVTVNVLSLTNNGTLTVSTNLAGTGELINSATGILNIGGVSGITTLTATAAGNTVNYTDGAQLVHDGNYYNLGFSGTGKKTLQTGTTTIGGNLVLNGTSANSITVADLSISGNLEIGDGNSFTAAGFALTVGGTTTVGGGTSGTLNISSATGAKLFTGLVTISSGATWNNSGNSPTEFRGGITTTPNFAGGNGIQTFSTNDQALNGTFSIPKVTVTGITLTNNGTLTVSDALEGTGGLTNAAAGILNIDGTSGITTLTATATGNTVNYTDNIQTVHDGNYYNLGLSGGFKKTLQAGTSLIGGNLTLSGVSANTTTVTDLTINGNLVIGDGNTFTAAGFALSIGGTTTIGTGTGGKLIISSATGSKLFTGLVTIGAGATWNNTGNSTVEFRGGITTTPNFTGGNGIHTFSTNDQALNGTFSIPNVTVNGITLTNNGTLTVSDALEGTGGLTNAGTGTLNINGTSGITTLTATATGNTVNYTDNLQTVHDGNYYNLGLSGGFKKTLQTGTSLIGGDLTLSGTSANTTTVADLAITGNLVIGDGNSFTADGFALTVGGTTTVGTGTGGTLLLSGATGTKLFTGHITIGSGAKWNDLGESPVEFRNGITHNGETFNAGNGVYSFTTNNQAVGGAGNVSIPNLKVDGVTLTNNCATLTAGTSLEGSGGVTNTSGNTLKINGTSLITTITATANNNIVAYFGDNQTVHNGTYNHLAIGGTGEKTISTADVTVTQTFAIRSLATVSAPPTFGPSASLRYNTSETRTTGIEWITPFTSSGGVAIFNTGTIILNENKVLNAGVPLSISDITATFDADSYSLTLGGGLNNNGTFIPDTGTVTFNGKNAQTVTGSASTPFYHLIIDNDAGVSTGNGVTSVGGHFTNNGTFSPGTGTIVLNGTSDQVIAGTDSTIFNNLTIDKASGGVVLGRNEIVNGTLSLTNGIIDGATYTLTIGPAGSVNGGSSASYVSGKLALTYPGAGSKFFPIGKGGAYRPVGLQLSGLTGTSLIKAEQFESPLTGDLPENSTLLTTNRHWTLTQSGGSNLQYFITLDTTDYTPSRPVLILKKDTGIIVSCATTTPNYTNSTAFGSFSEFGLGEACINPDDGGSIQSNQSGCPNFIPEEITGTIPTGQTGVLEYKWQSSTTSDTSGFSDIDGATGMNYTPGVIASTTWFRRLVKVDCKFDWSVVETSNVVKITIYSDCKISGFANYENNPKTPLNGLMIILKKIPNIVVDTVLTAFNGFYQFNSLDSGIYRLEIKSSYPGGQWQTWGGVNMTDYLLVYKHVFTGPQLPVIPPVVRIAADVKTPQNPPVITSADASAIQMAAKYGWGNPPFFQIPKWVFSGVDQVLKIDTILLTHTNVTRHIRGLCAGDVNGTYLPPNGYKTALPSLELENRGMIPVTQEMAFPVTVETLHSTSLLPIGALTLILNYDPTQIEITGVDMPGNDGTLPWFMAENGILSIGWASVEPEVAREGQPVLMIRARLAGATDLIRFTLNDNPLSELADGEGNVLQHLKLFIPDAGSNPDAYCLMPIALYPNPARDVINVEFAMETDGVACVNLMTLQGVKLLTTGNIHAEAGMHKMTLNLSDLPNGIYLTRVTRNGVGQIQKLVVNR